MSEISEFRSFFANLITANIGLKSDDSALRDAFASTPREKFVGKGPWRIFTATGYIETPTDDPAFLYQDLVIALMAEGGINNGQPSLHAASLMSLNVSKGETVLHVGCGTGYYTAILATCVGPTGHVYAYEVVNSLADEAARNLEYLENVQVAHRSGCLGPLPACDAIYVNAGATGPVDAWLDALRPGGRLLFPLTPAQGIGGMLLITRKPSGSFDARFVARAMFIPCIGARDDAVADKLTIAFQRDSFRQVKSLHRNIPVDETCWVEGQGWWLSTAANM